MSVLESRDMNGSVSVIILAIVALVIGAGGGYVFGMNQSTTDTDSDATTTSQTAPADSSDSADGVTVGGAKMVRTLDIVDNAAKAKNLATVTSLVKLADLVDTLKGDGPFTVFGPNNAAFEKLPAETVASLQKPENKELLTTILTYHVVPGTYTSADLKVMADKGETLKTVQGTELTPVLEGGMVKLKDAKGTVVSIETADVISSNGVTHVIDTVLMPQ